MGDLEKEVQRAEKASLKLKIGCEKLRMGKKAPDWVCREKLGCVGGEGITGLATLLHERLHAIEEQEPEDTLAYVSAVAACYFAMLCEMRR